jgi:hypothetical protein
MEAAGVQRREALGARLKDQVSNIGTYVRILLDGKSAALHLSLVSLSTGDER